MSRLANQVRSALPDLSDDDWKQYLHLAELERLDRRRLAWLAAGVAAVGLGLWALSYLGPDLRRYMKIESM